MQLTSTSGKTSTGRTTETTGHPGRRPLGITETTFNPGIYKAGTKAKAPESKQVELDTKALQARTWERQKAMWAITNIKALAGCHRWRSGSSKGVSLKWANNGSSRFAGLQNSNSVWASPIPAVAIGKRRVQEATTAVKNWHDMHDNASVLLLTLTLPHAHGTALKDSLEALKAGWAGIIGTTSWKKDREAYRLPWWHKALEITHGQNSFHPHFHVLLFCERTLSTTEVEALKARLFDRYAKRLEKHGWAAPSWEHGIDLVQSTGRDDAIMMGAYTAKGIAESWNAASEVAGQAFKEAKGTNRTPWQILDDIAAGAPGTPEYRRDVAIWREYEATTRGVKQTSWSTGAKNALSVNVLKDEDVATGEVLGDDEATEDYVVADIPAKAWAELCDDVHKRLDIANYVAKATTAKEAQQRAHKILDLWGIEHRSVLLEVEAPGRVWKVATDESRALLAVDPGSTWL